MQWTGTDNFGDDARCEIFTLNLDKRVFKNLEWMILTRQRQEPQNLPTS